MVWLGWALWSGFDPHTAHVIQNRTTPRYFTLSTVSLGTLGLVGIGAGVGYGVGSLSHDTAGVRVLGHGRVSWTLGNLGQGWLHKFRSEIGSDL